MEPWATIISDTPWVWMTTMRLSALIAKATHQERSPAKPTSLMVTTGQLKWTLNNPNAYGTAAYDWFGQAVAISGNYAIVGAPVEDMAGITSSGRAYIFDVTTGQLKWTLNTPSTYPLESQFGQAVSISGNYVVVGAPEEDVASKLSTGRVYIFDVTTGQLKWTLLNPDADGIGSGDRFGAAVSISGNHILVGAWGEADGSGRAYIFDGDDRPTQMDFK